MAVAHCIQRGPLQALNNQNQSDPTIQCQMCNCATFESYLRKHIQYNHMIHRRNIVDILYKLHYPAEIYCVQTQTANTWVSDLSLASLESAGCFRDDPHSTQKENSIPVKPPVLCSVCGDIESEMMIACDKCDGWYHWKCVGITEDPLPNDVWFCSHCINTETEDNLPAEESLPIQSPIRDSGNQSRSTVDNSRINNHTPRQNVTVEGQKFSESQILIRERVPERTSRIARSNQREQDIENSANIEQASTSQTAAQRAILITDIPESRKEEEDPFTEVIRRKRKKKSMKIEQENRTVHTEPIVTTEIDKEDTTPEDSFGSFNFQESNIDDFDIGNPEDDMIADELVEFQEQKPDIFATESVESEKTKLKIINTFSIKTKQRNSKSTRLGKRKEKKIGMLKLQEIIPSARKPLKILIGGKPILPQEETKYDKHLDRPEGKEKSKAVIVREIKSPIKQVKKVEYFQLEETWKGKGKGKGKPGRPRTVVSNTDSFEQLNKKETNLQLSEKPEHSSKPQNKIKIKRLSTSSKKQSKYMLADTSKEEITETNSQISVQVVETKNTEEKEESSKNSLSDLTPFIYRIHKGKRQAMRVHLSNRNNKMRLSQETIDFAKKYYLQKPDDWEHRYVYMNNQYMQLKCFKFIGDEYMPVVKNVKQMKKSCNFTPEEKPHLFYKGETKNAKEILAMKQAQAFGNQRSSNTSRKFSKEAMNACMEPTEATEYEKQPTAIIETQAVEIQIPGRKKKTLPTKYVEEEKEENTKDESPPKEHKIKSSIKKRSRKPSLTGKAKVALSFDTNTFVENKEEARPKEHSPQRNRLNNILDTLRTKNMERIHQLHDSDSAIDHEQPGPSHHTKPQYNIRHPSGSVVWAKMEESPWWPGMVDFCPDSEEYYWMEEESAEPSWYHVVFFDKGEHVTRSWVRSEWIQVFEPDKTFDHPSLQDIDRSRLNISLAMAINCLEKTRDQRLAKFSLASLFQGSWGKSPHPNKSPFQPFLSDPWEPSFIDPSDPFSPVKLPKIPDDEENSDRTAFHDFKPIQFTKREIDQAKADLEENKDESSVFHCLMCDENVAFSKSTISSHLTRHKVTLDDYPRIFVSHRDDKDMKMILDWIKADDKNSCSEAVTVPSVPTTPDFSELPLAAAKLARHAFLKSQRDMFAKAKFECDQCNITITEKEEFESHMKTHTRITFLGSEAVIEEPVDTLETAQHIYEMPVPVVDKIQPIKDWICTKPQYFTGYSVVIKTKERRVANLELAFSNAPPPPPPKEREAQEPVLPSPRLSTHKPTSHSEGQSKTSSSKRESSTLPSKGSKEQNKPSSTKRIDKETSIKNNDSLHRKAQENIKTENQPQTVQPNIQNKSVERKDNPKTCHSVETLLVHKPQQKTQSLEVVTVKKEDADRCAELKKDASKTILTTTSDNIASENPEQKEESPEKEALDLTVK